RLEQQLKNAMKLLELVYTHRHKLNRFKAEVALNRISEEASVMLASVGITCINLHTATNPKPRNQGFQQVNSNQLMQLKVSTTSHSGPRTPTVFSPSVKIVQIKRRSN